MAVDPALIEHEYPVEYLIADVTHPPAFKRLSHWVGDSKVQSLVTLVLATHRTQSAKSLLPSVFLVDKTRFTGSDGVVMLTCETFHAVRDIQFSYPIVIR